VSGQQAYAPRLVSIASFWREAAAAGDGGLQLFDWTASVEIDRALFVHCVTFELTPKFKSIQIQHNPAETYACIILTTQDTSYYLFNVP